MLYTIPKTFLITGLGRSGTSLLASILARSRTYRVTHEWRFFTLYNDRRLRRFPILRFLLARQPGQLFRRGYGEVNSVLRHYIGVTEPGPERWLERRAIIVRDPREVIASAMNRRERTSQDFPELCETIMHSFARLRDVRRLSPLSYETFWFIDFTSSVGGLQTVIDWTGITDVQATDEMVKRRVNQNRSAWFPPPGEWSKEYRTTFDRIAEHVGVSPRDWQP